jgi:hypothetical protein
MNAHSLSRYDSKQLLNLTRERLPSISAQQNPRSSYERIEFLRKISYSSALALARATQHDVSTVHADITKLEKYGLAKRSQDGMVFVPFEALKIHLDLLKTSCLIFLTSGFLFERAASCVRHFARLHGGAPQISRAKYPTLNACQQIWKYPLTPATFAARL